ncbi:MAG: helix-turn-helix domain-containing protein [bacterium]|nr:helix-turn-helix domain-containing protein [bacterium]
MQTRKQAFLKAQNTLNRYPERIQDDLFLTNEFFDPDDNVQRKYEMLRRVQLEGWTVSAAAQAFGFSRPSFYRIQRAFQQGGLSGLLPKKVGPKGAHKLMETVLNDLEQARSQDTSLRLSDLIEHLKSRFGIVVHPRSLERALARRKKKESPQSDSEADHGSTGGITPGV